MFEFPKTIIDFLWVSSFFSTTLFGVHFVLITGPTPQGYGALQLKTGLSAGFEGCTRHPLRAQRQLRQTYSGRSALRCSETRRPCDCHIPTMESDGRRSLLGCIGIFQTQNVRIQKCRARNLISKSRFSLNRSLRIWDLIDS